MDLTPARVNCLEVRDPASHLGNHCLLHNVGYTPELALCQVPRQVLGRSAPVNSFPYHERAGWWEKQKRVSPLPVAEDRTHDFPDLPADVLSFIWLLRTRREDESVRWERRRLRPSPPRRPWTPYPTSLSLWFLPRNGIHLPVCLRKHLAQGAPGAAPEC